MSERQKPNAFMTEDKSGAWSVTNGHIDIEYCDVSEVIWLSRRDLIKMLEALEDDKGSPSTQVYGELEIIPDDSIEPGKFEIR